MTGGFGVIHKSNQMKHHDEKKKVFTRYMTNKGCRERRGVEREGREGV